MALLCDKKEKKTSPSSTEMLAPKGQIFNLTITRIILNVLSVFSPVIISTNTTTLLKLN